MDLGPMSADAEQVHWKEPRRVTSYEVDLTNRLRLSSIFNFMQEAASNSADHLGFGYDRLKAEGLFWVLSRARLLVLEYAKLGEEIVIDTWPKKTDGIFAVRDFRIRGRHDDPLALATTCWLMLDEKSMRPVRPAEIRRRYPFNDSSSAIEDVPGKIIEPAGKTLVYEKQTRYMDIDVNRHVNNVSHISSILDCFPLDQFRDKRIASIHVNYTDELKYGELLRLFRSDLPGDGGICYIDGVSQDGKKVFQSLVEWK